MIDTAKIALMSRAAFFEEKGYERSLRITGLCKKDYLILHVILAWVSVTAAYVLLLVLWLLYLSNSETGTYLLNQVTLLFAAAGITYVTVCVIYIVYALCFYRRRYGQAEQLVEEYRQALEEIQKATRQ